MTITQDMIDCWKTNFGLDTMTPEDAFRWWSDRNNGMAPAGAVVAFGLALKEIERLRAAIRKTLDENGHLADGENCTLIDLKRVIGEQ